MNLTAAAAYGCYHSLKGRLDVVGLSAMTSRIHVPMLPSVDFIEWCTKVNGTEEVHLIEGNAILLDVLRDSVGTLGVKRVHGRRYGALGQGARSLCPQWLRNSELVPFI